MVMAAYYNEHDPFAAAWLRELIKAGHIASGDVDERSIEDIRPSELRDYTQCHFFAGIGVWSYALRSAGWADSRPVWTGSCPCQPFSAAGKRKGTSDERHLWPAFYHLISVCRPITVFGEQVASKDGLHWLGTVQADLENAGYAFGAVDLCSAGFGAPHIRQRLYFVGRLLGCAERILDNPAEQGLSLRPSETILGRQTRSIDQRSSDVVGFWQDADWIYCRDKKLRPVEPGSSPLVTGASNRVGRLRGYGNSLTAQVAQGFIESYLEYESSLCL